jgi:hypothetical protein
MSNWPRLGLAAAKACFAPRRVIAATVLVSWALAGCGSSGVTAAPQTTEMVSVTPATATVPTGGVAVSFSATVQNGGSSGVTWEVNGVAGGDSAVGTISASGRYVSPATVPSPATVTIQAVSTTDPAATGSATITVDSTPQVSVSVSPATASVVAGGGTQAFMATVSNAANTAVTWSVNGVAGGNATVGTISSAGLYTAPAMPPAQPNVQVTAVSVADSTKSGSASVTVTGVAPPTISGTPATTAKAGQAYSFTPTASSPRGGALTFSISNKPGWAAFNTATGQLSGTPATTDIGTFSNITITVSDGTATASLAPFTITVQSGTTGSATLSWTSPTTRTDGTALTNLAGFRIYYGTSPGTYPNMIPVANPGLTTYVVPNLVSGTYYFVATSYDSTGVESAYTNVVSTTIP